RLFASSFLYSYCPPRDLHSFPTRRSSDLLGVRAAATDTFFQSVSSAWVLSLPHRLRYLLAFAPDVTACPTAGAAPSRGLAVAWRDRKSTRLNSSHDQISYAVFCLKKKKIT